MPVTRKQIEAKVNYLAEELTTLLSTMTEETDTNRVIQLLRTAEIRVLRAIEVAQTPKEETEIEDEKSYEVGVEVSNREAIKSAKLIKD